VLKPIVEARPGRRFSRQKPVDSQWEQRIRASLTGDDPARLELARSLAETAYYHPECEAVRARPEQRSFYMDHDRVTERSVLLLHGWTACPFEMRELGLRLYAEGYNVVGPRLAGHGTRVEDFVCYGGNDWWAAAREGLEIAALSGRTVTIIGESMGGSLAALLAQAYPQLVQKLILCAPCFEIANPLAPFTRWQWVQRFIPQVDMGPQPEWMRGFWYSVVPTSAIAELVQVAAAARRTGPLLATPVVIIQADEDQMVRPVGAHRYLRSLTRLAEGEKRLIAFSGGHHNLTVSLNPQKERVFKWILSSIGRKEAVA
jgi:carboxylesterase